MTTGFTALRVMTVADSDDSRWTGTAAARPAAADVRTKSRRLMRDIEVLSDGFPFGVRLMARVDVTRSGPAMKAGSRELASLELRVTTAGASCPLSPPARPHSAEPLGT